MTKFHYVTTDIKTNHVISSLDDIQVPLAWFKMTLNARQAISSMLKTCETVKQHWIH